MNTAFVKIKNFKKALTEAPFLWRLMIVFTAGSLLCLAQAPYNFWLLIFPCFGLFYLMLAQADKTSKAFLTGFFFTFGYFLFGLSWIGNALLVEGNDYQWAWPLAVVGLPMGLAIFTALFSGLVYLFSDLKTTRGFILFCALISIAEWVRGYAFTGFPWNLYGYVWSDFLSTAQIVSVVGPYGLTLLTIFWGATIGFLIIGYSRKLKLIILCVTFLSFLGVYLYGHQRLSEASTQYHDAVAVHLVQPNIDQADKWRGEKFVENFEKHIALSAPEDNQKQNIIIWAETAIPPALLNNPSVDQRLKTLLGKNNILLAGGLDISFDDQTEKPIYHNALMLWDQQTQSQRIYSKSHLVPFGEYIPFQNYIPISTVTQFSGFAKGTGQQTIKVGSTPSFSPLICYEIIFPRQTVKKNSQRPDYILTITNDGWYGDSAGPYQHFDIAKFRAIEQGIPVVRVANTGISGLIDSHGRTLQKTKILEESYISHDLPQKIHKITFYAQYGDAPYLGFVLFLIVGVFLRGRYTTLN